MRKLFFLLATIIFVAFSCQKEVVNEESLLKAGKVPDPSNDCSNYQVTSGWSYDGLSTTFTWTVVNLKPGNGTKGTTQDLSHVTFEANGCLTPGLGLEDLWSDVVGMYYKYGDGLFVEILPTPIVKPDLSNKCSGANVFKFDYGTYKSQPTTYKIVLLGKWGQAPVTAWFKSGVKTGCCSQTVMGVGCREQNDEWCSFGQGYYFAKPGPTWPGDGTVTIGGFTYTEEQAREIWNTSNAGGIPDSKKGFTQVTAIKLSQVGDPMVLEKVAIIESWLVTVGKLSPTNLPSQTVADIAMYGNVAAAAGWLGDWINDNHCVETPE